MDENNPAFTVSDGILFSKGMKTLLWVPSGTGDAYSVPDDVSCIADAAFQSADLTQVTIPAGVLTIGENAFSSCSSLTAINVSPENPAYCSAEGVLYSKDRSILYAYPAGKIQSAFTIPNSVTEIGSMAFFGAKVSEIKLSDSVSTIRESAFSNCYSLEKISLPDGLKSVEFGILLYSTSLQKVYIPGGITDIASIAFMGCSSLTDVYFGGSKEAWNILMETAGYGNEPLLSAAVHFNCSGLG